MFSQNDCIDRLRRGLEMEEKLVNSLSQLCMKAILPPDLPEASQKRISQVLKILQTDTLRHEKNVRYWLAQLEQKESPHE